MAPPVFDKELSVSTSYIFHTERIYERAIFDRLIRFCKQYRTLTGEKAICVLMTPNNPLVAHGRKQHQVDEVEYLARAHELAEIATLGYHGHFWTDPQNLVPSSEMKGEHFLEAAFKSQFESDLQWFEKSGISHQGAYSGGWWFMNRPVLRSLIQSNFSADFSFSYAKSFQNPYSIDLMRKNEISVGAPFRVQYLEKKMVCIQNFIGCHPSPFLGDFVRNFNRLVRNANPPMIGVLNSHDYDLDDYHTLKCIEMLIHTRQFKWMSYENLTRLSNSRCQKTVILDES